MKDDKFKIDFFELSFLAEACIPPKPIARTFFWQNLISKYFHQMTANEKIRLFNWLNRNDWYQESLKKEEWTQIFHARFDPDSQFKVTTELNGKEEEYMCFKLNDRYYTEVNKWIVPEYIKKVEYHGHI